MFTIEIQDYPVFVRLGYFPQERLVGQEVLVSIEAQLHPSVDPSRGDDLKKTVDYGELLEGVNGVLKGAEIKLVETACDQVAQKLMQSFSDIEKLTVSIEKTALPSGIAKGARVRVRRVVKRV